MKFINLFINQVRSCFGFKTEIELNDRELPLLENEMGVVSEPVYVYDESEPSITEFEENSISEGSINYDSDIENEDFGIRMMIFSNLTMIIRIIKWILF